MTYDRRGDRRSGGGRPPGGRSGGGRSDRPPRPQESFGAPRGGYGQRGGNRTFDRSSPGYAPRTRDEGGMSIRLDPRRLAALKLLAGEEGLRPGELVTRWVEERLDAARAGEATPSGAASGNAPGGNALAALSQRVDELARRLDAFTSAAPAPSVEAPTPRRRGRPPKEATAGGSARPARKAAAGPRVPLHEEIMAVIGERGPMTAGELAAAIKERGRYSSPRSAKPFDAATINARVSNPVYRARFTRDKGRIGLASTG